VHVVVSESRVLTALHEVGLVEDLFGTGHQFHAADIFLANVEIEARVQDTWVSGGLMIEELSSADMMQLLDLRRANPSLCVGNAASLTLSLSQGYPVLVGNTGLATLPAASVYGLLDLAWIMGEVEAIVPLDRLHQCIEAVVAKERRHLHSPEVAARLQSYLTTSSTNMR